MDRGAMNRRRVSLCLWMVVSPLIVSVLALPAIGQSDGRKPVPEGLSGERLANWYRLNEGYHEEAIAGYASLLAEAEKTKGGRREDAATRMDVGRHLPDQR